MRVVGVCGSLQRTSSNAVLLQTAVTLAPDGVEVVLFDGLHELPFFNSDLEAAGAPPPVDRWRRELAQSDAVLIASPEYGHSLSGVLKNAIDWVIGSGELYRKVVAITVAVKDPRRGHRGLDALAQTLVGGGGDPERHLPLLSSLANHGCTVVAPHCGHVWLEVRSMMSICPSSPGRASGTRSRLPHR